jgi:signal transduction histidine kinase
MVAVLPAILGIFTVAALAYWGRLYRHAPEWVVVIAAVAAVASLVLTWRNTRYVARRIERLAGPGDAGRRATRSALAAVRDVARPREGAAPDEIDSIEHVVTQLSSAVTTAEAGSREREAAAGQRVQEYASLLAEATSALSRQLDEVRLPIHILLEGQFGTLNENQEEMLAAARAATEAAAIELRRLREIAELDRGALTLRREQVRVGDLLLALRPQLEADAERCGVKLFLEVTPGLPRVAGDRLRLQEALELFLRHMVGRAMPDTRVTISVVPEDGKVAVEVEGPPPPTLDANVALARRIIQAHGGSLDQNGERARIILPALHPLRPAPPPGAP